MNGWRSFAIVKFANGSPNMTENDYFSFQVSTDLHSHNRQEWIPPVLKWEFIWQHCESTLDHLSPDCTFVFKWYQHKILTTHNTPKCPLYTNNFPASSSVMGHFAFSAKFMKYSRLPLCNIGWLCHKLVLLCLIRVVAWSVNTEQLGHSKSS